MSLKDYVLNEKGELCHPSRLGAVLPTKPKQDTVPALDHSKKRSRKGPHSVVLRIRLVRVGARLLDSDNLAASFKSFRDAIALSIGVDDGDPRVEWGYDQITGKPYGTIVMFTT